MLKHYLKLAFAWLMPFIFSFSLISLSGCDSQDPTQVWSLVEDCDLHQQACISDHGDAQVELSITPRPLAIAKPLDVQVTLHNLAAEQVDLDISGLNMYMGYNRVALQPSAQAGQFKGRTMLAFCTNEIMLWQVTLLVTQPNGELIQIPFKLETRNR